MVEQGHVLATTLEVSTMPVPAAEIERDVTGTRFDFPLSRLTTLALLIIRDLPDPEAG